VTPLVAFDEGVNRRTHLSALRLNLGATDTGVSTCCGGLSNYGLQCRKVATNLRAAAGRRQ
jgi:hypothetical protein